MAALPGGRLVVNFANRKNAPFLFSTRIGTPPSQEAADRAWKAFAADPEWIKVRDASEADGKILAKPPERVYMKLTDYSPSR